MFPGDCYARFRSITAIAALLGLVSTASCQTAAPKLTEGEKFIGLRGITMQAGRAIPTYGAKEVYTEIDKLIKQFKNLYGKAQQAKDTDAIIGDIETGITAMAACYRTLASKEIEVTQNVNKEYGLLRDTFQRQGALLTMPLLKVWVIKKALLDLRKRWQGKPIPLRSGKKRSRSRA
jgi:hypothetical protein